MSTTSTRPSPSIATGSASTVGRRFGSDFVEMLGATAPIYLLKKAAGSAPFKGGAGRDYRRHWTPVHLDFAVTDIKAAVARARATPVRASKRTSAPPNGVTSRCWPIRSATASVCSNSSAAATTRSPAEAGLRQLDREFFRNAGDLADELVEDRLRE